MQGIIRFDDGSQPRQRASEGAGSPVGAHGPVADPGAEPVRPRRALSVSRRSQCRYRRTALCLDRQPVVARATALCRFVGPQTVRAVPAVRSRRCQRSSHALVVPVVRHHLHRTGRAAAAPACAAAGRFDHRRRARGALYRADDDLRVAFGADRDLPRPGHAGHGPAGARYQPSRGPEARMHSDGDRRGRIAGQIHGGSAMPVLRPVGLVGPISGWSQPSANRGDRGGLRGARPAPDAAGRAVLPRDGRMGRILVRQFRQLLPARARAHGTLRRPIHHLRDAAGRADGGRALRQPANDPAQGQPQLPVFLRHAGGGARHRLPAFDRLCLLLRRAGP